MSHHRQKAGAWRRAPSQNPSAGGPARRRSARSSLARRNCPHRNQQGTPVGSRRATTIGLGWQSRPPPSGDPPWPPSRPCRQESRKHHARFQAPHSPAAETWPEAAVGPGARAAKAGDPRATESHPRQRDPARAPAPAWGQPVAPHRRDPQDRNTRPAGGSAMRRATVVLPDWRGPNSTTPLLRLSARVTWDSIAFRSMKGISLNITTLMCNFQGSSAKAARRMSSTLPLPGRRQSKLTAPSGRWMK